MKYIIFGAGNNSQKLIVKLRENLCEIEAIIDNDSLKWGSRILGIEVKPASYLEDKDYGNFIILISVADKRIYNEIKEQLFQLDLLENKNFYDGLKFLKANEEIPGRVSGYVYLTDGLDSVKTFDPASRLVKNVKEKKIFRVVCDGYEEEYRKVFEICKKGNLYGKEIVNSYLSNKVIEGYRLVIEHEYIEPITYCFEWAPLMIFDYVDFMLELLIKLADVGLGLLDGHTLNTTISNGKFIFLDFGAIQTQNTSNATLLEFLNTHVLPLILFSRNQLAKGYMHLKNPGIEFTLTDVQGYLTENELKSMNELYSLAISSGTREDVIYFAKRAKENIIDFKTDFSQTSWLGYQDDEWAFGNNKSQWSDKMVNAIKLIKEVSPETVIDLAGNMGWYGSYLCNELKYSVIMDTDYSCIDNLWRRCRDMNMTNVIPVYMSICSPTLSYYRDEPIEQSGITAWRKAAVDRLRADLVIALAVIHHLVFRQQLTFEEIINQFWLFSNRYLLIEFVCQEDQYITDFKKVGFEWYTKENFQKSLEKKFVIIEEAESTPNETRTMYLCEKCK